MARAQTTLMLAAVAGVFSCVNQNVKAPETASVTATDSTDNPSLPADADHVAARLIASPRHGEWVMIRTPQGDSMRSWVVYPQRRDRASVVIVVHEVYGLSSWVRSVADQLAAAGFIAIAPDLLTMSSVPRTADTVGTQDAISAFRLLKPDAVQRQLDAVAQYGMGLPSALKRYGIVGFCRGGDMSFAHAAHAPSLGASVVYYGSSPSRAQLGMVRAPVLGLYAGSDARVDATIPLADSVLLPLGRTYVHNIYEGAGHGFLRQQTEMDGANMKATREAWLATVAWFHKYLGS